MKHNNCQCENQKEETLGDITKRCFFNLVVNCIAYGLAVLVMYYIALPIVNWFSK